MSERKSIDPIKAIKEFPAFPVVLACVGNEEQNVITLGMVHVFSLRPPVLGVGISPSRYSYELFEKHQDFSVNIPGKQMMEEVMICGTLSGREADKFARCGLEVFNAHDIQSPLIADCEVNFECRKTKAVDAGDHAWFLGEVVHAHRLDDYVKENALMYWGGKFWLLGEMVKER